MNILLLVAGLLVLFYAVARQLTSFRTLALITGLFLLIFTLADGFSFFWGVSFWLLYLLPTLLFGVSPLREQVLSRPLLARIRQVLPPMSETERDAIEAGSVWWESELFRGSLSATQQRQRGHRGARTRGPGRRPGTPACAGNRRNGWSDHCSRSLG